MMFDLSIIILSYNTKSLLETCLLSVLESLSSDAVHYEVIVVDNGSTDGSRDMVKKIFPSVRLIRNKENAGYGKANNQAAKIAKGEYLFFLNSDCEVLDEAVLKLFRSAQRNHKNIVGGKLLNRDKSAQASCGHFYTLPVVLLSLFFKGDQLHLTRSSPDRVTTVDWVSGACLLMHRDEFKKLQGFDEAIFMYMDEVDLCYRAKKLNIQTIFYPDAQFIHVGAASSADRRSPYVNLFSGLLYFYKKHWPDTLLALKFLLILKAYMAMILGKMINSRSLLTNYQKALSIVRSYD